MTSNHPYQKQLDSLCRKQPKKVLTGIEKHEQEQREATEMWEELKRGKGDE